MAAAVAARRPRISFSENLEESIEASSHASTEASEKTPLFLKFHAMTSKRQEEENSYRQGWVNDVAGKLAAMGGWDYDLSVVASAPEPVLTQEVKLQGNNCGDRAVKIIDGAIPAELCSAFIQAHERVGFTPQATLDATIGSPEKLLTNQLIREVRKSRGPSNKPIVVENLDDVDGALREEEERYERKNTSAVLEVHSLELAETLWTRLQKFIPTSLKHPSKDGLTGDSDGTWTAVGVIPVFRFMRYEGGQSFKAHADPARYLSKDPRTGKAGVYRSFVTLALYLNDAEEFQGGALNFVELVANPQHSTCGPPFVYTSLLAVQPRAGRVALFEHESIHEAGTVSGGVKYMMQCDLLYRRND